MSDEAFARRFYSDRAELTALGVPLAVAARRVHRRGALHAPLRALLPRPARARRRRARGAADGALLPRGEVRVRGAVPARAPEPRARTRRLRRAADGDGRAGPRQRARLLARARRPALEARVRDLEAAHGPLRLLEPPLARPGERAVNPYALRLDDGNWYVVGHDLDRDTVRTFKVSRIRGDIRFATRRERDFRVPAGLRRRAAPGPAAVADRRAVGRAGIAVSDDTAWWVERTLSDAGVVEDGVFETEFANVELLAGWVLRQNGRAVPLEPGRAASRRSRRRSERSTRRTTVTPPAVAGPKRTDPRRTARPSGRSGRSRRSGSASCRRFSRTCSRRAATSAPPSSTRPSSPRVLDPARGAPGPPLAPQPRELRRRLLRRLRGARRRRRPRRQGALRRRLPAPAEAHAARGAGDPARDRVRRPDDRRRRAHAAQARAARSSRRRSAASTSPRRRSRATPPTRRRSSRC